MRIPLYHLDAFSDRPFAGNPAPAFAPAPVAQPPADLVEGLGTPIEAVLHAVKNFYAVLPDEAAVRDLRPDLGRLRRLHPNGVSVSAPGSTVDFVSRFFAPSYGI